MRMASVWKKSVKILMVLAIITTQSIVLTNINAEEIDHSHNISDSSKPTKRVEKGQSNQSFGENHPASRFLKMLQKHNERKGKSKQSISQKPGDVKTEKSTPLWENLRVDLPPGIVLADYKNGPLVKVDEFNIICKYKLAEYGENKFQARYNVLCDLINYKLLAAEIIDEGFKNDPEVKKIKSFSAGQRERLRAAANQKQKLEPKKEIYLKHQEEKALGQLYIEKKYKDNETKDDIKAVSDKESEAWWSQQKKIKPSYGLIEYGNKNPEKLLIYKKNNFLVHKYKNEVLQKLYKEKKVVIYKNLLDNKSLKEKKHINFESKTSKAKF